MGLLILPFLIAALAIVAHALIKSYNLLILGSFGFNEIGLGFLISLFIFGCISLSYINKKTVWAFSPIFRVPVFTIFIPFLFNLIVKRIDTSGMTYLSSLLLLSISINGILGIVYNVMFFKVLNKLKIEKHY